MVVAADMWRGFYARSFGDVAGYALRLTAGDRAAAEDLVHDAYLAMVRAWRDGRVDRLETGWLVVVVRQRFLNNIRSRERESRRLRLVHGGASAASEEPEGSIADLLAGMGERERAALVMRYVDDLSVGEVADGLGLSVRATESLLVRAREKLRRKREEEDRLG
ncbi:MAG: subfamily polymerase sigma-24 factor [Aeromicrobium sp.]|nr:subfamily polymerase sigma-24 factor [Aeromicrobium sp.]